MTRCEKTFHIPIQVDIMFAVDNAFGTYWPLHMIDFDKEANKEGLREFSVYRNMKTKLLLERGENSQYLTNGLIRFSITEIDDIKRTMKITFGSLDDETVHTIYVALKEDLNAREIKRPTEAKA